MGGHDPEPDGPAGGRITRLGIRVSHPSELASALDAAIANGRPAIVDVISDPTAMAPTRWMPEPTSFPLETAGNS